MKTVSTWRVIVGALLLTGGAVAACSNHSKTEDTTVSTPLGQSTAPGPSNPNVPQPDSAGVPSPDQPVRRDPTSSGETRSEVRVAQGTPFAGDAGVGAPVGPIRNDAGPGGVIIARDAGAIGGIRTDAGVGAPRPITSDGGIR
ncbi:MAG: hypothetical protein JWO36_6408 [Myxococcales bacterium]|nr:hypothetical protein [Myxococcales bacterium]